MHEFQNLHAQNKEKIHQFIRGHFYGHHTDLDLNNTLYFFIAGRCEYRNKGVDLFLEALSQLNERLCRVNSPMTIIAFIIMPAPNRSYTVETLNGHAVVKKLQESVVEIQERIGKRLFDAALKYQASSSIFDIRFVNNLL
jgi:glycogen synthase